MKVSSAKDEQGKNEGRLEKRDGMNALERGLVKQQNKTKKSKMRSKAEDKKMKRNAKKKKTDATILIKHSQTKRRRERN